MSKNEYQTIDPLTFLARKAVENGGIAKCEHMDCYVVTGSKLAELITKANKWDARAPEMSPEYVRELQDKAAKYDAMQAQPKEHPCSPTYREDWRNYSRELPNRIVPHPDAINLGQPGRNSNNTAAPMPPCVDCGTTAPGKRFGAGYDATASLNGHGMPVRCEACDKKTKVEQLIGHGLISNKEAARLLETVSAHQKEQLVGAVQAECVAHQRGIDGICVRCNEKSFEECGPGIRWSLGGKFTEPGEVKIACDHGWDE